nr:MAG TPA: Transcription termination factor Rho, Transcription, NusG, RecA, ATPase, TRANSCRIPTION [Caudoviricetes sp.]
MIYKPKYVSKCNIKLKKGDEVRVHKKEFLTPSN